MTKQEFTERTGFTPTDANFALIHEEYMEAGPNVGKDQFCKEWLKNGGPQRAYDWARQVGTSATAEMLKAKAERDDLSERVRTLATLNTGLTLECTNHKQQILKERNKISELEDKNIELRRALMIAKLAIKGAKDLDLDDETRRMVMDTIDNTLSNR